MEALPHPKKDFRIVFLRVLGEFEARVRSSRGTKTRIDSIGFLSHFLGTLEIRDSNDVSHVTSLRI